MSVDARLLRSFRIKSVFIHENKNKKQQPYIRGKDGEQAGNVEL
jgi:hypothetical protein